jgi:hypothetical protein
VADGLFLAISVQPVEIALVKQMQPQLELKVVCRYWQPLTAQTVQHVLCSFHPSTDLTRGGCGGAISYDGEKAWYSLNIQCSLNYTNIVFIQVFIQYIQCMQCGL